MLLRALQNQFHVDGGVEAVVVAYEVESRIDDIRVFYQLLASENAARNACCL